MNKINFTAGSAIQASQLNTLQTNIDNAYAAGVKSVASSTNSNGDTVLTFTHYDSKTTTITLPKGSSLNFNIVGGTTAPASPTENTIWVKTSTTITDWAFATSNPYSSPSAGAVFFRTASGGVALNVLSDKTIYIYINGVQQYINNKWSTAECSIYQNGKWVSCKAYIPSFTYTGDYKITNDEGVVLSGDAEDWQIHLLTSGVLSFTALNGAADGVDIFLVGGGAGGSAVGANTTGKSPYQNGSAGGGSGYTSTEFVVEVSEGGAYNVSIGAGGAVHTDGGATSIAIGSSTYTAAGGKCSTYNAAGGNGGSGGGGGGYQTSGAGGVDGGNGGQGTTAYNTQAAAGGAGQGSTTRAFEDSDGVLYATGGGAGGGYNTNTGASMPQGTGGGNTPNTGNGGKGGGNKEAGGVATAGGSGIVIIRNTRG